MQTVLIAEDEVDIRNLLTLYLEREYKVISFSDGEEALSGIMELMPDIILLDVLLPGMNGFRICEELRSANIHIPVIFISAKREQSDKIRGLEMGADDYITKPFDPGELMARVKANLRRNHSASSEKNSHIIEWKDLRIDLDRYTVTLSGNPVHLSTKEMQLLILLATNPRRVYSTEQLYDLIWGEYDVGDLKTVSVHISKLRKKIERNPSKPDYIITVRGFGYKFLT
ncbi:response regulator transcription factor [Bacillus dakarensis]|uniref:response regulator transcription factor n=1 Tax=Robertmurraya dakarensis TaxID=1926278 RepID=UPI000981BA3D|nr:response regulator transcription factor [Bacillus dakarensis]